MYYIYGISGPSLLIESTDSMIKKYRYMYMYSTVVYTVSSSKAGAHPVGAQGTQAPPHKGLAQQPIQSCVTTIVTDMQQLEVDQ